MTVVETDVMIDIQRCHPPPLAWFFTLTEMPAVPGLVVMELIQDARNAKEVQQVLKLVLCQWSGRGLPIASGHSPILRCIIFRMDFRCWIR